MAKDVLTETILEPLNGANTATIHINAGDGNLLLDRTPGGEQVLASGTLQYFESQGLPKRNMVTRNDQAILTLGDGTNRQQWFRFPWQACNGATEWHIHLNPEVSSDITAHSNGGNVKLNLDGMAVTRVSADTGGGNMDVVLPDEASNLSVKVETGGGNVTVEMGSNTTGSNIVTAKSGAGNVVVRVPRGIAARIHAATGMGKVIMDPQFIQAEKHTYQSPGFESAANKVEITVNSGAGNVGVEAR